MSFPEGYIGVIRDKILLPFFLPLLTNPKLARIQFNVPWEIV